MGRMMARTPFKYLTRLADSNDSLSRSLASIKIDVINLEVEVMVELVLPDVVDVSDRGSDSWVSC